MPLSTKILGTEAYVNIAGNQVFLTGSLDADTLRSSLGLSSAMHFIGITTTAMTDGRTTATVVVGGNNYTPAAGDVVLYDDSEYVWTGSAWERLGRDSSFKTTQSAVSSPAASGSALAFIDTISQNGNGVITVTKKNLGTVPIGQGGTGKTSAKEGFHALTAGLTEGTADITDNTVLMSGNTNGATNDWYYRKGIHIYNYIAGKANGTWGISIAGIAAKATQLETARKLKTKLDSTADATFDGTADQLAIPVTGILPITNGGTGGDTAATARLNLGIGNSRVFYGVCTTAAATTAKVVTCAEYDSLKVGDMVIVKFDATNTGAVASLTLNVNSTGAKNIKKLYNTTGASNLTAAGELNKDGIAVFVYNGTYWILSNADYNTTYYYTSIYCTTAAATAAKAATISSVHELTAGKHFQVWMYYTNTAQSALTLNISSQGAKPIYINGTASSSSNYTLPRGCYIVYYDGTNYHFRTDGKLPGLAFIGALEGNATTATAWETGRTLTIGGTGKSVDGSADVSWSLNEIGASVGHNFTAGTSSAAPKFSTTVNGVTSNEVTLTTATTSVYGVTKLTDTVTSSNSSLAVTGKAVNTAITNAINALDMSEVSCDTGEYFTKISETNGIISVTKSLTSVGNTLTDGTDSTAPKISTTVNGVTGNEIILTKASTSVYGVTKLTDSVVANNSNLAVTGTAVSAAITAAIGALDVASAGGSTGHYISAISETDGKISATVSTTSVSNTLTAGTSSDAPKISTTVNGITGNTITLTTASTSVYGATKLTNSYTSTNETLATTGKALLAAIQTLDSTLPSGSAASKTLTALTITDGKMASATFTNIAIAASQVTSGELPIARGGTGASTAANALKNLLGTTAIGKSTNPIYWTGSAFSAVSYVADNHLGYGDANLSGTFSHGDIFFNEYLRPNRLAGTKASGVTIEYSDDGGATWNDYGATDIQKRNLFTSYQAFRIAGPSGSANNANCQLRITLATASNIYTTLYKFHLYIGTNYSQNCKVTIKAAKQNDPTNYTLTICENQAISGWSGWNVINFPSGFTTYGNNTSTQYGFIQFIFTHTGLSDTSKTTAGLSVYRIFGYGGVGWTNPSNMATTGHAYTYDGDMNVVFPASVTGNTFAGKTFTATHVFGGGSEFNVKYGTTVDMSFMIGSGNVNHGIYDHKKGDWALYAGSDNNWKLLGNADTATLAYKIQVNPSTTPTAVGSIWVTT